jgi:deaminated glutathione amidase
MGSTIRVAAVQMCAYVTPVSNLGVLDNLVAEAANAGATYVQTPEVSITFARDAAELTQVTQPFAGNAAIAHCANLAHRHQIHLHLGSLAVALENGKFANRSVVFGPDGAIVSTYDKIHLFDADPPGDRPYRESDNYQAGCEAKVVQVADFQLGLSICFDIRFPTLYAALAEAGAEVLAVPAAFTVPTGQAHWEVLLRARAIETGSFVIAAAQGGTHENGRKTFGHSMIIDPWGRVVAHKNDADPGVIVADIDLMAVKDARARLPALANRRAFSVSVNQNLSK